MSARSHDMAARLHLIPVAGHPNPARPDGLWPVWRCIDPRGGHPFDEFSHAARYPENMALARALTGLVEGFATGKIAAKWGLEPECARSAAFEALLRAIRTYQHRKGASFHTWLFLKAADRLRHENLTGEGAISAWHGRNPAALARTRQAIAHALAHRRQRNAESERGLWLLREMLEFILSETPAREHTLIHQIWRWLVAGELAYAPPGSDGRADKKITAFCAALTAADLRELTRPAASRKPPPRLDAPKVRARMAETIRRVFSLIARFAASHASDR